MPLAAILVAAFGCPASAQSDAWPAGKNTLPWLEGRWSSGDCQKSYTEYRFSGADRTSLRFNFGPANRHDTMRVDVYYDADGNVVLYFPSLSYRTVVRFKNKNLRDTTDIDKDGKVTTSTYRRCDS